MQLFVDVLEVPFHGGDGHTHAVGNSFIAKAMHDHFKDFPFAVGEAFDLFGGGGLLAELADDFAGNLGSHGDAALVGFLDGGDDFFRLGAFQEVTAGARAEGAEDHF